MIRTAFLIFAVVCTPLFAAQTCIRVGEGTIAPVHQKKLEQHGIDTLGVIDTDSTKREATLKKGLQWFESIDQAFAQRPDFWDVCVPPEEHLPVMKKIMQVDPYARILVEKPICMSYQISELLELLKSFQGKIVVNENYLSSEITETVLKMAFETLQLQPRKIVIEMDKNRIIDIKRGRYVDPEGAFKYEGTHILTILQSVLDKLNVSLPMPNYVQYEPLVFSDRSLENQGSADIQFKIGNLDVLLFSSMNGTLKYPYPPYAKECILEADTAYRYRILAIEGESLDSNLYTVVGFYEPLANQPRCLGEVALFKNGKLVTSLGEIPDDSMGAHLHKAADYLLGKTTSNPCTVEAGIEIVQLLDRTLPTYNLNCSPK